MGPAFEASWSGWDWRFRRELTFVSTAEAWRSRDANYISDFDLAYWFILQPLPTFTPHPFLHCRNAPPVLHEEVVRPMIPSNQ